MEIKNLIQKKENINTDTPVYIPSSSEKKRVVLMYLFVGIMVYLSKKEINTYEYYHLKQSSWWWILFLFAFIISIVLLFIPVINIFWILLLLFFLISWVIGIKQAWDWKYLVQKKISFMELFYWVWNWFLWLFEIGFNVVDPMNLEWNNSEDIDLSSISK